MDNDIFVSSCEKLNTSRTEEKIKDIDVEKNTTLLLDSSLISDTSCLSNPYKIREYSNNLYQVKLIQCGDYIQVYSYPYSHSKKIKNNNDSDYRFLNLEKEKFDDLDLKKIDKSNNKIEKNKDKIIELKNINRSKFSCQRIAKSNINIWKSFITLTFKNNLKDVDVANKRLHYFFTKIRRVKKDFAYLCIPEFQKRGAVHYHLLTNIACDSLIIPKKEKKHLYNPNIKQYKDLEYYDIKFWLDGFSSAEPIINDPQKIIGYISKYMTKDIDNRLFSNHRYFCSKNLIMPIESYINIYNKKDLDFLNKKIHGKNLLYQNEYVDKFDNLISFHEYL